MSALAHDIHWPLGLEKLLDIKKADDLFSVRHYELIRTCVVPRLETDLGFTRGAENLRYALDGMQVYVMRAHLSGTDQIKLSPDEKQFRLMFETGIPGVWVGHYRLDRRRRLVMVASRVLGPRMNDDGTKQDLDEVALALIDAMFAPPPSETPCVTAFAMSNFLSKRGWPSDAVARHFPGESPTNFGLIDIDVARVAENSDPPLKAAIVFGRLSSVSEFKVA